MLRVLMIARSTMYTSPGGDTTQVLMTAKYLRKLKVHVDIKLADDVIHHERYDIIHFFNIIRPDDILTHLRQGPKIVISPVFVDFSAYDKTQRRGMSGLLLRQFDDWQIEYIKSLARYAFKGDKIKSRYFLLHGQRQSVMKAALCADLLLPNSHSEQRRFETALNKTFNYRKVVYAVDDEQFNDSVEVNREYANHIICVGRIEGRKNQLNLIKAVIDTPYHLTIIGKPALNQLSYYEECKAVAATCSRIKFVPHITHSELASIYKSARVHVLPSWFETCGLSSLEAGIMNCNIVITRKGDTEEYFGDYAYYCEPDDVQSIRESVTRAYNDPIMPGLREYILQHYTWRLAAQQTMDGYLSLLPEKSINKELQQIHSL
ncbi:glycosyltransferase family 4 protein [Chryseolinea sp. T2]|uniref:glycosyltransferase family 4 protein n=1 Tax=Chryseolinea sp. T2 TaxID=3129255 RepID=UPI0030782608